jgi:PadR family transcriptional regulator PadR
VAAKRELVKGSADTLLLCLLAQQPMYGYQIIKVLEHRSQGYFKFKEGTLYPALHRLERSGLVEGNWQMLANGRPRRYYRITARGHTKLSMERGEWVDFINALNLIFQPQIAD